MIRAGIGAKHTYLLTTRGRISGEPLTHPVTLIEGRGRYLVAPYGVRSWVKNARAAGEVTLRRGRRVERCRIEELPPEAAGPILERYAREVRVVRPYLDASPGDPLNVWIEEARTRPVFRLEPSI